MFDKKPNNGKPLERYAQADFVAAPFIR